MACFIRSAHSTSHRKKKDRSTAVDVRVQNGERTSGQSAIFNRREWSTKNKRRAKTRPRWLNLVMRKQRSQIQSDSRKSITSRQWKMCSSVTYVMETVLVAPAARGHHHFSAQDKVPIGPAVALSVHYIYITSIKRKEAKTKKEWNWNKNFVSNRKYNQQTGNRKFIRIGYRLGEFESDYV